MANPRNLADIAPLVSESSNNVGFTNTINLGGGVGGGVVYLNGSKVATSGVGLTFDGTKLGVGGSANASSLVTAGGTLPVSDNSSVAFFNGGTFPATATSTAYSFASTATTEAGSYTLSNLHGFAAFQGTFGSGSTVTNQYGFYTAGLSGATNNYGFYSGMGAATGRWNFYAAGTADNYFAGNVGIGATPLYRLHTETTFGSVSPSLLWRGAALQATYTRSDNSDVVVRRISTGVTNYSSFIQAEDSALNTVFLSLNPGGGNVGVGTSSPGYKLDVHGTNSLIRSKGTTGYGAFYADGATGDAAYYFFAINGTETARLTSTATNYIAFSTNDSGIKEKMRLTQAGNLVLGDTSSSYKLDVSGNMGLRGVAQNVNDARRIEFNTEADPLDRRRAALEFGTTAGTSSSSGYLAFWTANYGINYAERMRIDAAGNMGLGTAPSAWQSSIVVGLDIGQRAAISASNTRTTVWNNAFRGTAGINYYKAGGGASYYDQDGGIHIWASAASGTAGQTTTVTNLKTYTITASGGTNYTSFGAANNNVGTVFTATSSGVGDGGGVTENVTFTQAMTLRANGNLLLGTTSDAGIVRLAVHAPAPLLRLQETTTGGDKRLDLGVTSGGNAYIGANQSAQSIEFQTVGTPRMILDASGSLGIAMTAAHRLDVNGLIGVGASSPNPGLGGNVRYRDDTGAQRWAAGVLGSAGETSFGFYDFTSGSERMILTTAGNLGLGVTPTTKLQINTTAASVASINTVTSFGSSAVVSLGKITNNSEGIYLGTGTVETGVNGGIAAGIGFMREAVGWNSALVFYTNGTTDNTVTNRIAERMRLNSSGNLLLNTTVDTGHRLQVDGHLAVRGGTGFGSNFQILGLPEFWFGQSGILDEYLVLNRVFSGSAPGNTIDPTTINGRIIGSRGGQNTGNVSNTFEINAQTAYTNSIITRAHLTYLYDRDWTSIDVISIDGVQYYALKGRTSGGENDNYFFFQGSFIKAANSPYTLTKVRLSTPGVSLVTADVLPISYDSVMFNEYRIGTNNTVAPVAIATNGDTISARFNQYGIALGNNTATSGMGIVFPATQSASSNANTLDDYEEGVFTPSLVGTETLGVTTYTETGRIGRYTKIGNRCYFNIWLNWINSTATGFLTVSGLPFQALSTAGTYNTVTVYVDTGLLLSANNIFQAYINAGTSGIVLTQYPVGGGSATLIPMDPAASIMLTGSYEIN